MEPKFGITHIGLFSTNQNEVETLAERVNNFNINQGNGRIIVKMTARWVSEASPHCPVPHYDILFEYEDKDVADKFWTE